MSNLFYILIIMPLLYIIEIIFNAGYRLFGSPGLAIVGVSLGVSILVLPLYKRADEIQNDERQKQKEMQPWVDHIKIHFRGDERSMMLQTYYREKHYSPIFALRSSISLLLQIPFFIAAYRFLSNSYILNGATFGFIKDLSQQDGCILLNGISINLLPLLMTAINCLSGYIYSKGFSSKEKIQIYVLAIIFLVFLYRSPAGMVLYWTLNNVFSLFKNLYNKFLCKKKKELSTLSLVLAIIFVLLLANRRVLYTNRRILFAGLIIVVPLFASLYSFKNEFNVHKPSLLGKLHYESSDDKLFWISSFLIACIIGLLIPSQLIIASPIDFINRLRPENPVGSIRTTLICSIGLFCLWGGILYYLADRTRKAFISRIMCIVAVIFLGDFLLFGKHLGTILNNLQFDASPSYSKTEIILNLAFVIVAVCTLILICRVENTKKTLISLCKVVVAVLIIIGMYNTLQIHRECREAIANDNNFKKIEEPIIHLSKENNNVVVLMLDRAIGAYPEYIFDEKPELYDQFDGFVWYPNTISFGGTTNYSVPSLFGGYEYTPVEMNRRNTELLQDKHDEALKVLPTLFSEKGYAVTLCDPSYAGYQEIPDLSVFDGIPNLNSYITMGNCKINEGEEIIDVSEDTFNRNLLLYGIFKTAPVIFQPAVYDDGNYYSLPINYIHNNKFLESYVVLDNLKNITDFVSGDPTYTMMVNKTTHEAERLQVPDYIPVPNPAAPNYEDNYIREVDDHKIQLNTTNEIHRQSQINHYMVNVASYLELGSWLEYLKENDAYDNTRIIIVSDHGAWLGQFDYLWIDDEQLDIERYNPLLLFKDFNSHGTLKKESIFMTCADVPTLSLKGIIEKPLNPYTGNPISNDEKYKHEQIIVTSNNGTISNNNGYVFDISREGNTSKAEWYAIKDNIFDYSNWKPVDNARIDTILENGYDVNIGE